jgi:hypothetical protein
MTVRLAKVRLNSRAAWVIPTALAAAGTVYLAWGAWVFAPGTQRFVHGQPWWQAWLRPGSYQAPLAVVALWLAALLCYWWPRRLQAQLAGLVTVVAMVVIGAVLGTASLAPCRGPQSWPAVAFWVLGLYVGNPPAFSAGVCQGPPPLALQLGEAICLAATLAGALAVAAVLWRQPLDRLRARFVRDATVVTGLDAMTIPLLRQLAKTGRPASIVVIEPDSSHPLLEEARTTGVRVMIGDPASERILLPVLAAGRGCALRYLYALRADVSENEAVLQAARSILLRHRPGPERQPHLVARIDDPRHADHWRGRHCATSGLWFEDALSSQESTASALVNRVFRAGARQLLLCGDSTLALAILLELAHRTWQRAELAEAAEAGRAAHPDAACPDQASRGALAPSALERVVLLHQRAQDLRREYLATSPRPGTGALPAVIAQPSPWRDRLLAMMDAMTPAAAAGSAVVIADTLTEGGMHEAGRVARLHPLTPVFVLTSEGAGTSGAIFDLLQPFQRALLVDGEVPEDTWTTVARHWHECFRLRHPPVPGDPRTLTGRPWRDLDDFIRQDNILQLRSVMTAVVDHGRQWVPARAVPPGSFIELNDRELEEIARAEHTRWYQRRLAAGWSAGSKHEATMTRDALVNSKVVPWASLPEPDRAGAVGYLRSQLAQLEDVGFMPVVPEGGPPGAADFRRIGTVRARRLRTRRPWVRPSGEELSGDAGDWWVTDHDGDERTVRDVDFHAGHEPLGGGLWRRTGTFRAWRASEDLRLRTMEGQATARSGDWVVEGHRGQRWPVSDRQFRRTYQPASTEAGGSQPG